MSDAIKLEIEQAWDKFCEGFDLHSNEWLDKGAGEMFEAGYLAALRAQPDHSELVTAARAVVERWETPLWKDAPATAGYINRLRDALPSIGETME